jgi:hypothetical protein
MSMVGASGLSALGDADPDLTVGSIPALRASIHLCA